MSDTASPAPLTASIAAATQLRPSGQRLRSEVWLRNTLRGDTEPIVAADGVSLLRDLSGRVAGAHVLRDPNSKVTDVFDPVVTSEGIGILRTPGTSTRPNAIIK